MTGQSERPKVPVDFNNCDEDGAVRLITPRTTNSLEAHDVVLVEGLKIIVTDDELLAEGEVTWRDGMWVCAVTRWLDDGA